MTDDVLNIIQTPRDPSHQSPIHTCVVQQHTPSINSPKDLHTPQRNSSQFSGLIYLRWPSMRTPQHAQLCMPSRHTHRGMLSTCTSRHARSASVHPSMLIARHRGMLSTCIGNPYGRDRPCCCLCPSPARPPLFARTHVLVRRVVHAGILPCSDRQQCPSCTQKNHMRYVVRLRGTVYSTEESSEIKHRIILSVSQTQHQPNAKKYLNVVRSTTTYKERNFKPVQAVLMG